MSHDHEDEAILAAAAAVVVSGANSTRKEKRTSGVPLEKKLRGMAIMMLSALVCRRPPSFLPLRGVVKRRRETKNGALVPSVYTWSFHCSINLT